MEHEAWCSVCDAEVEKIEGRCAVCGCVTPRCPECKLPLSLLVDDDDERLSWTCEPCGVVYGRGRFPVPRHIQREHDEQLRAEERRWTHERELEALSDWNAGRAIR